MGSRGGSRGYDDRQLPLPFNKQKDSKKIINFQDYADTRIRGNQENTRKKIIDRLLVSADQLDW